MTIVEKEYSMNNFQLSIAMKSIVAQLINSVVVPFMVNYYIKEGNIYGVGGLAEDIFVLALTNSLVPPLVRIIDPYYFFL